MIVLEEIRESSYNIAFTIREIADAWNKPRSKCFKCNDTKMLHRHHLRYARFVSAKDFMVLCPSCHGSIHRLITPGSTLPHLSHLPTYPPIPNNHTRV